LHRPCFTGDYIMSRLALHSTPIDTVQSFWRHYNNIPLPSALHGCKLRIQRRDASADDRDAKASGGGGSIDAVPGSAPARYYVTSIEGLSLFQHGVCPDWEDPHNATGTTITFKTPFSAANIDRVWMNALLAVIGETAAAVDRITGIRIIDRSANYRLEVWADCEVDGVTAAVSDWFLAHIFTALLGDGSGEATSQCQSAAGDKQHGSHARSACAAPVTTFATPHRSEREKKAPDAAPAESSGCGKGDDDRDRHHKKATTAKAARPHGATPRRRKKWGV
jgi:hypothetical protein